MCHWLPLIALDCPWSMTASPPLLALLLVNSESWIFMNLWWVLTGWRHSPRKLSHQSNYSTCCTCSYWHPLHLHISSHHPRRCSAPCNPRWFSALKARSRRASTSKPLIPTILQPQGSSQSSQWLHNLRPYWLPLGIEHNETRKQNQADLASFTSRSPGCCRTWKDILERFAKKWRAPILTTNLKWTVWVKHDQTWSNMIKHGLPKHKVVLFISESSFFVAFPVFICVYDMLWAPNLSSELSFRRRSSANSMASFH